MPLRLMFFCAAFLGAAWASAPKPASADPSIAAEIAIGVGKEAAVAAAVYVLGEVYDSNCGTPDQPIDMDAAGAAFCTILELASGRDEDLFREEVTSGLSEIKDITLRIESQVAALRSGQKQILDAIALNSSKIDAVAQQTVATDAVAKINSFWRAEFAEFLSGGAAFSDAARVDLAWEIIGKERLHRQLDVFTEVLTQPGLGGAPPLLERQMSVLMSELALTQGAQLTQAHRVYQTAMTAHLADYNRGEVMVAWALGLLAQHCGSGQPRDAICATPPRTLASFGSTAASQRAQFLRIYRAQSERLVLAYADTGSADPNFFHPDTEAVLMATDLYLAMHDPAFEGLRGRVISAGEAFSGAQATPRAIPAAAQIDWWTRPAPGKPYDRVHFAPFWRVYDVAPQALTGAPNLPWASGTPEVVNYDRRTGRVADAQTPPGHVMPYGFFLATARAGGAYAFMTDAWEPTRHGASLTDARGNLGATSIPAVAIYTWGTLAYNTKATIGTDASRSDVDRISRITRLAPITLVDGGKITFHGTFSDPRAALDKHFSDARLSAIEKDMVLRFKTNAREHFANPNTKMTLFAGISFGSSVSNKGIGWDVSLDITKPTTEVIRHPGSKSVTETYAAGTQVSTMLTARALGTLQTIALDANKYELFAGIRPTAIYITRE